jgi:hypothetical protein
LHRLTCVLHGRLKLCIFLFYLLPQKKFAFAPNLCKIWSMLLRLLQQPARSSLQYPLSSSPRIFNLYRLRAREQLFLRGRSVPFHYF